MTVSLEKNAETKRRGAEVVLKQLNLALKSLQLYPANHATTAAALNDLLQKLLVFLSRFGYLTFDIFKDGLKIEGEYVCHDSIAARSLALQLYRLKLEQLSINASINHRQLTELLMVICMDAENAAAEGGARELLWQKKVSSVSATETSLKLVREAQPNEDAADSRTSDFSRLRHILLVEAEVSDSDRPMVKKLLGGGPDELALFLNFVADSLGKDQAEAIADFLLPRLDRLIRRELPDEKTFLYRNLAEAIMRLDGGSKAAIVAKLVNPRSAEANITNRNILEQISNQELAGLLRLGLELREIYEDELGELIIKLPVEPGRLNQLTFALMDSVDLKPESVHLVEEAKSARESAATNALGAGFTDFAKTAVEVFRIDPGEIRKLRRQISELNAQGLESKAISCLAQVMESETNMARLADAGETVNRILSLGFERGDLGVAANALAVLVAEAARREKHREANAIFKELIRNDSQKNKVERLFEWVERDSSISTQVERYLALLDSFGIITMLDMLATEERPGRRRLICQLLASCSRPNLAALGSKVMDHRWYLVRNVVAVLGQIGDASVISHLQSAAKHADPRVRLETARALAKLGPQTLPGLLGLVNDVDRNVRLEAIRGLGRTRNPAAVPHLAKIITARDLLKRQSDVKIEAITALGSLRAAAALPLLRTIAGSGQAVFANTDTRLKEAAIEALSRMSEADGE